MNLGQSRMTRFKKACFFKITPESPFCDRRWWRWTAFVRLKIEIFQYKKRMPEDRVHNIPESTSNRWHECEISVTPRYHLPILSCIYPIGIFSPLALSLITELFLFLSYFVTFWFQLRRFIPHIFKRDERKQAVVDSLMRYVTTEIPLTAFHPGLRSLKKSRENTICLKSWVRWTTV